MRIGIYLKGDKSAQLLCKLMRAAIYFLIIKFLLINNVLRMFLRGAIKNFSRNKSGNKTKEMTAPTHTWNKLRK